MGSVTGLRAFYLVFQDKLKIDFLENHSFEPPSTRNAHRVNMPNSASTQASMPKKVRFKTTIISRKRSEKSMRRQRKFRYQPVHKPTDAVSLISELLSRYC